MTKKHSTSSRPGAPAPAASRARKQFDALAAELQPAQALARAWEQADAERAELAQRELPPLADMYVQRLKALVLILDKKHEDPGLDEEERLRLSDYLADATGELLEMEDDAVLEELFEKHSAVAEMADLQDLQDQAELREMLEELYETEIDEDIDLFSEEGRQQRQEAALEKAEEQARRHETQMREAIDALLREVHAAAPSAELETAIQRAEAAAAEEDLLALVKLRLELEQGGSLGHFSEKRLSACNKLLQKELSAFKLENAYYADELAQDLPDFTPAQLTPEWVLPVLHTVIAQERDIIARLERELDELQDLGKLKTWLREIDTRDYT